MCSLVDHLSSDAVLRTDSGANFVDSTGELFKLEYRSSDVCKQRCRSWSSLRLRYETSS